MAHRQTRDTYRRRRHRSALLRRGVRVGKPPSCCRGVDGGIRVLPLVMRRPEAGCETLLWGLACRVTAYPGVHGMLYRRIADRVAVTLVAPCPMTRPMRILAEVWTRELDVVNTGLEWVIQISETPPEDAESYRCLFWRTV